MKKNMNHLCFVWSKHRKKLLIMRNTLLILLISVFQVIAGNSYSQTATLNLEMKNATIRQILERIEEESNFYFLYNEELVDVNRKVSISVKDENIEEVLSHLFDETEVKASINGRHIVLTPAETITGQQKRSISGTVKNQAGEPLPGVTIRVKGTNSGTISDVNGSFTLSNVSPDAILQFSFVGMKNQDMNVEGKSTVTVIMEEGMFGLEEVVAIGYGTMKKSDLTGSVAQVKAKDLSERPATNLADKMQGKAAGIDITQSSGLPGATPTIRIRGNRSILASNNPLFVVDGIPLSGGINSINPSDIESIEILKDAASAAIYGSRGANGVILVTTKRGKSGKTDVSYQGYYGVTRITRMVDMMNGEEFAEMRRESYRAIDAYTSDEYIFDPWEIDNLNNGIEYDYPDMILSDGYKTDHKLGITGGNEKTQYAMSFGYYDEQGVIENNWYTRYSFRINLDHMVNNWLKVGTSTTMSRQLRDIGSESTLKMALRNSPIGNAYDPETGEPQFYPTTDGVLTNPLFEAKPENYTDETKFNNIFSTFYSEISFTRDLKYRVNFGVNINDTRQGRFVGSYTDNGKGVASAYTNNSEGFTYTLENILTYNKIISQVHKFNVTLMQSIEKSRSETYTAEITGLPYETASFYNLESGEVIDGVSSQLNIYSLASFMGRVNYDLNNKYLLQASIRADGSSRLAEGHKWDYFPSVALGWRLSNEPFMENVGWLSFLKIRSSYGVTGNTAISPYKTQGLLAGPTPYSWDETSAFGYALSSIPNYDLKWERTATVDAGLDFGLWKGRLSGNLDFYRANTTDLLMNRSIPITSGYTSVTENVGSTRNTGFEVTLSGDIVRNPNGFNWSVDLNWFTNKEEIVELYNEKLDDVGNGWFIGEPISVYYDYEKEGIWQTSEADLAASYGFVPGEIKVKDQDDGSGSGDGVINADDRVIIGSPVPDWSMGITNRMEYKGFDLSFFIYTRYGSTIYSRFHSYYNTLFGRYNNLDVDYWTPDNPTNAYPRPNQNQESPRYNGSLCYFDGTFVKLRNVTLGYTLPKRLIRGLDISNLRIYVTADNPLMITKYEGYDPEDDNGYLDSYVPSNKAIIFGVNVNF